MPPLEAEDHPRAKLTREQVIELRRRARAGETVERLAAEAGVAWSTTYRAVVGESWQSVDAVEPPVAVKRRRWLADELMALGEHADEPAPVVAERLGRTTAAVHIQRSRRRQ